ncbi:HEAT repeat-containing protein [Frankineae bacterium MT45]|nr:HEAT repeat-containing protein [Frankineae bacterium MT45]
MSGPLLAELAAVGFPASSVSELRESGARYRAAVPVLVKFLDQTEDPRQRQEIVRALSVPWAGAEARGPLIREFKTVPLEWGPAGDSLRWAVGNALEVLFDDASFTELVELAEDPVYGKARQMVVLGFGKSKRPEAVGLLLGLVDDPDVDGHAVKALGKLKAPSARAALEAKLDDKRAWVRSEARKALARLPAT